MFAAFGGVLHTGSCFLLWSRQAGPDAVVQCAAARAWSSLKGLQALIVCARVPGLLDALWVISQRLQCDVT